MRLMIPPSLLTLKFNGLYQLQMNSLYLSRTKNAIYESESMERYVLWFAVCYSSRLWSTFLLTFSSSTCLYTHLSTYVSHVRSSLGACEASANVISSPIVPRVSIRNRAPRRHA